MKPQPTISRSGIEAQRASEGRFKNARRLMLSRSEVRRSSFIFEGSFFDRRGRRNGRGKIERSGPGMPQMNDSAGVQRPSFEGYSDPKDDGFFNGDDYPSGGWRPRAG